MAASLVVHSREGVTRGRRFYKMSGSGNDFLVFDSSDGDVRDLADPGRIRRLTDRRLGVGADGVVIIQPSSNADVRMKYFNSDGSAGAMCGNAALCVTRLAAHLGLGSAAGMILETDDGLIHSRLVGDRPEIDLAPVRQVREAAEERPRPGERRVGYAIAGVPHVVVLCDDVARADVATRGAELRRASWTGESGANVDFVSQAGSQWAMRTFERGVEAETLACGTGAVATATLLRAWGLAGDQTSLRTRSGCILDVGLRDVEGAVLPRLAGEGRMVFEGFLSEG
jgi:diaminopimelate epimerase